METRQLYRNLFNTQWSKCLFAERFIKTLKNKICEYITSILKNVSVDKLNDIVDKHKGRGSYSTLIENQAF